MFVLKKNFSPIIIYNGLVYTEFSSTCWWDYLEAF